VVEFDQASIRGETDEGPEISVCLFAASGDALEPFDASHALFDTGAAIYRAPSESSPPCRLRYFSSQVLASLDIDFPPSTSASRRVA
jgi:hypothetical protein